MVLPQGETAPFKDEMEPEIPDLELGRGVFWNRNTWPAIAAVSQLETDNYFSRGVYEKFSSANIFLNIYVPANIFFQHHLRAKNFFPFFFSVFFLFVINITIALLNCFTKKVINSAIAPYIVDMRSTHLLNIFWQQLT